MFLGVEYGSGVIGVVAFGISGRVPVVVSLLVTGDTANGIYSAVYYLFPILV